MNIEDVAGDSLKIRVGRQGKAKQSRITRSPLSRKAQHRKFPMNLGGIFWICSVLFRRELQTVSSWAVHVRETHKKKGRRRGFSLGPARVCVNIRVLVFAILWWVPQLQRQIYPHFCAPPSVILLDCQSSPFCCSSAAAADNTNCKFRTLKTSCTCPSICYWASSKFYTSPWKLLVAEVTVKICSYAKCPRSVFSRWIFWQFRINDHILSPCRRNSWHLREIKRSEQRICYKVGLLVQAFSPLLLK
jgi:hypothetical protein